MFDLSWVEVDTRCIEDFREIDACIRRLGDRTKPKIERAGPLARSKVAWKLATFQEAVLHRVVMLARGVRLAWNARNLVTSFLATRALVETIALFDDLQHELSILLGREALGQIDEVIMNRTFSTRDEELLRDNPEIMARNVLGFIDKLGKRYDLPIRSSYDGLSERCHPNSAGHHAMFSTTDYSDASVTFSEVKNPERALAIIRAPLGLLILFERSMIQVNQLVLAIAELQHRIVPIKGFSSGSC
jgi:hypothetical protein